MRTCWVRVPRFYIAICVLFVVAAPSIAAAQRLEFEATPSEMAWPPAGEVSFEELCHSLATRHLYDELDHSQPVTCRVTERQDQYVVVELRMGPWQELHLLTRSGPQYRYFGELGVMESQGNHAHRERVAGIRIRTYQGQTYVFLQMQHRWSSYHWDYGFHECANEYLRICRPNEGPERCGSRVVTRQACESRPTERARTDPSWWQLRDSDGWSRAHAELEVSTDGLLHVTLQGGAWSALDGWSLRGIPEDATQATLRFAPPPPLPEQPPFIEGVPRADDPSVEDYPVSLEWHTALQALCDDARGSTLDVTTCSEEHVTRNLSIVRTRDDEDVGPTFLAERRGRSIRLISRMSDPNPQPSALQFVRYVRGPGHYFGVEFEERISDALATTRRHLLVCQRGQTPRCTLRVPLRVSTQRRGHEVYGRGLLQTVHVSQAEAEIRRDGTLTLTRVSGTWAELFGIEPAPTEEEESVTYRYR